MNAPKISVIVPVYNTEKWLRRCVDSILAQTYTDFELLLIDDGSTDSSGEICDEYAQQDSRIRVFHKPNGGVSSARNLGLDNSKGDWITFCDADDYVYPCWLDNFSPENENYDLKCQGIKTDKSLSLKEVSIDKREYGINIEGDICSVLEALFQNEILGYTVLKTFKNSIITRYHLRFDVNTKFHEDELFVIQYAQYATRARSLSAIGYYYFIPDWFNKYSEDCRENITLTEWILKLLQQLGMTAKDRLYKSYLLQLIYLYIKKFDSEPNARKDIIKNLRNIVKRDYANSQIFYPTRFLIRFDRTGILSSLILQLHLKLKGNA
jgi:glycosyltransferase, family 2